MTFVALMLQKNLGNICFSIQLGAPEVILSALCPPPHPHPTQTQWPLGVWRGWNKWMYLPWGNKSAPCGVVAIGKGSFLTVSLEL